VIEVKIDQNHLKAELRRRITDPGKYKDLPKMTLASVMARAAELAASAVDALAAPVTINPGPSVRDGRLESERTKDANEKRARLRRVMQAGVPMKASTIGRLAQLTPGELSHLLKHTPGIERVGPGSYRMVCEGAHGSAVPARA
jgi:hypothetical protein